MDRPASPGSRADDRNPRRSWPTGRRSSIREWWSRASRSWTYEEGGPKEECATARARPRTVRRQGRYGQRRVDRAETGVLSDPRETRDGSARSPALQRHDLRPSRAVRAAQPPRPELPAAWRARRRRYHLAQDRRPGEGVFHRAPASRAGAPQMSDRVLAALEGGVLTATLNRPEKKNAIDTPMIDALLTLLDQADLDAAVRVVAVRGAGSDFCAGMDLNELLASADKSVEENRQAALRFAEIFVRMRRIPKPIVAVVQGRALAGGCGLATACDLVLATESAKFGYPEVQRGFVPAIVMTLLKRTAGEKVARSEEHTSELQSRLHLVCRLLLEKKKKRDARGWGGRCYCWAPSLGWAACRDQVRLRWAIVMTAYGSFTMDRSCSQAYSSGHVAMA